ncbi:hypothetical protein BDW22DRAFT_693341 [Trametopsis cervina]|nr:hypothetical protein BDW22DRAFT_693341 [Trametopsis cervina]
MMQAFRLVCKSIRPRHIQVAAFASRSVLLLNTSATKVGTSYWRTYSSLRVENGLVDQPYLDEPTASQRKASAPSSSIRIQNIPLAATYSDIKDLMSQFGPIRDVVIRDAHEGANFKRATVQFMETEDADTAVKSHNKEHLSLHGAELFIRYGAFTKLKEPSKTVFVGNFLNGTTQEEALELIKPYIDPQTIRMNPRGFAHVVCRSIEDATALIDAHEAYPIRDNSGRLLRMNYNDSKPPWRVLCISGFEGTPEDLERLFEEHDFADKIVSIKSHQKDASDSRPPLYFVRCVGIPEAEQLRTLLQSLPEATDFHVDFGKQSPSRQGESQNDMGKQGRWNRRGPKY